MKINFFYQKYSRAELEKNYKIISELQLKLERFNTTQIVFNVAEKPLEQDEYAIRTTKPTSKLLIENYLAIKFHYFLFQIRFGLLVGKRKRIFANRNSFFTIFVFSIS